jgi:hypothetical protein
MSYAATLGWRNRTKIRLISAFGGSCGICGYSKCYQSLDFHHLDSSKKEFGLSARIKKWETIIIEARKCVLLCANCHREVHAGEATIPSDIKKFDESYAEYRIPTVRKCIDCEKEITFYAKRCDNCQKIQLRVVERPSYEQLKAEIEETSYVTVGRKYGVSDKAIRKWLKQYEKTLKLPPYKKDQIKNRCLDCSCHVGHFGSRCMECYRKHLKEKPDNEKTL